MSSTVTVAVWIGTSIAFGDEEGVSIVEGESRSTWFATDRLVDWSRGRVGVNGIVGIGE